MYKQSELDQCNAQFNKLVSEMKKRFSPDVGLIKRAYRYALEQHDGVRRKSGEPYILHPLAVAQILADTGFESDIIAAALLHDVLEDCDVTQEALTDVFNQNITDIVYGVTAIKKALDNDDSKSDIDILSDIKLMTDIRFNKNRKALYVKLADRIHNLRTIDMFSDVKKREKVQNTQNILIPLGRENHIYQYVDILEDLCFKIQNPESYQIVSNCYETMYSENEFSIQRFQNILDNLFHASFNSSNAVSDEYRSYVVSYSFKKRFPVSIYRNIGKNASLSLSSIRQHITKYDLPIVDIHFITADDCPYTPSQVFFHYYTYLYESPLRLTMNNIQLTMDEEYSYFIMRDRFQNQYRIFIQTETEHLESMHGAMITGADDDIRSHLKRINTADPADSMLPQIKVFKRDGSELLIDKGATVLDFAFRIHPAIGLCAKYALLNGSKEQFPLYTRLNDGDRIDIVHDAASKHDSSEDIPHATIRWFEYVRTREAIHELSRWFETYPDNGKPEIPITYKGQQTKVESGATVLDFIILQEAGEGLHVQNIYINGSKTAARLNKILRYGDKVEATCEPDDKETPKFEWLKIVRTKEARDRLVEYFEN